MDRCVASNSSKQWIHRGLSLTDQLKFFSDSCIYSADEVPHSKPAPDLFLHAARKKNYHTKECVIVEDSVTGIQAALAAGIGVIEFLGGKYTKYKWYREMIEEFNIPIADTAEDLLGSVKF